MTPTTPWKYGLQLDPTNVAASVKVVESPVGDYPFSSDSAPVQIIMKGRRVPEWQVVEGSAGPLPHSPIESQSPEEPVTLIPYGAAKLRITVFPQIARDERSGSSKPGPNH